MELVRSCEIFGKTPAPPVDFAERAMDRVRRGAYPAFSHRSALEIAFICCILGMASFFYIRSSEVRDQIRMPEPQLDNAAVEMVRVEIPKKATPVRLPAYAGISQSTKRRDSQSTKAPGIRTFSRPARKNTAIAGTKRTVQKVAPAPESNQITGKITIPLYQIKTHISMELVRLLDQTIEMIERGEQQWEVKI